MNNDPNVVAANHSRFSRTPNLCTPRSKRVLNTVTIAPAQTGILRSMLNAKAVPNTEQNDVFINREPSQKFWITAFLSH
jgi:hypothetical protein